MIRIDRAFIPTAVAAMIAIAFEAPHVAIISALACVGMVACDFFGTLMNVAENRGQDRLAGYGDMGSDFFGKFILAGYAGSTLTHGHGTIGWVAIWPILVTGFYATGAATRWARHIKVHEGCEVVEVSATLEVK